MNRAILFGGLFAIMTALAGVARADSGVELVRVTVEYTLPGFSHVVLYHDALAVCVEGEASCDVYIDDRQAVPAWAMTPAACLERAVVWSAGLDEPSAVLGCEAGAEPRVLVVDAEVAR